MGREERERRGRTVMTCPWLILITIIRPRNQHMNREGCEADEQ